MTKTITPHKSACKIFVVDPAADVSASQLDLLKKDYPHCKPAWERKMRVKDNSASACEAVIAESAVMADFDDQTICNFLIASKRYHGDDFVSDPDYYARTITRARAVCERAQLLNAARSNGNLPREEALRQLSSLLTVDVTSIQRFHTDPRSYVMRLDNGSYIEFKCHSELLKQTKLAGALFDYARIVMPTFKNAEWVNVKKYIAAAIENVESSSESTHLGSCIGWLTAYLRRHLRPEMEREGQVRSAVEGKPAFIDGLIWFSMDGFKRSIMLESSSQPPAQAILSVRLKQIGCAYVPHKALRPSSEVNVSRSLWSAPKDFMNEELKALGKHTSGGYLE
jgi:hypothetical protein